jgi:hypothetical protein
MFNNVIAEGRKGMYCRAFIFYTYPEFRIGRISIKKRKLGLKKRVATQLWKFVTTLNYLLDSRVLSRRFAFPFCDKLVSTLWQLCNGNIIEYKVIVV